MAGTAGSGGLGALGIGGIAAAAVVAGGVVAYLTGVFGPGSTPEPGSEPSAEPAVVAPANGNTAPSGTAPEQTAAAPAPKPAEEPVAEQDAPETAAAEQPVPAAPSEPEAEPVAEAETQSETDGAAADAAPSGQEDAAAEAAPAPAETPAAPAGEADSAAAEAAPGQAGTGQGSSEAADPQEQETEADAGSAPAEDSADAASEPQAEQPAPAAAEPAFVLAAPQLDTVRFEPDGSGLIAGRAQPGSEVSILLDGDVLDRFPVDAGGEFVAFVAAPPSENQRVLSLLASLNGQTAVSDASFILGATRVPVVVAEADTAPAPETAAGQPVTEADAPEADEAAAEPAEEGTAAAPEEQQPAASEAAAAAAETEDEQPATEAPAAVAVLRADSSGITVVQPAANGRPDAVALDTLSYTDTGNVEVAGRASPDTALRVYVDNTAATDLRSAADGSWSVSLGGIAPGSYTLRVDQVNAQGIVLSRVETPFTREAPEVLAEAAPEADPQAPEPALRAITVRKGDSLWAISRKAYGDGRLYVRLFDANRNEIKDPDLIYPGQVFALPE